MARTEGIFASQDDRRVSTKPRLHDAFSIFASDLVLWNVRGSYGLQVHQRALPALQLDGLLLVGRLETLGGG